MAEPTEEEHDCQECAELEKPFKTAYEEAIEAGCFRVRNAQGNEELKATPKTSLALFRAQKRFSELDVDKSGKLEKDELVVLAEWVWTQYHPEGEPISDKQKVEEGEKLLALLDQNGDGAMSFEEFSDWFRKTLQSIIRYNCKFKGHGHQAPPAVTSVAASKASELPDALARGLDWSTESPPRLPARSGESVCAKVEIGTSTSTAGPRSRAAKIKRRSGQKGASSLRHGCALQSEAQQQELDERVALDASATNGAMQEYARKVGVQKTMDLSSRVRAAQARIAARRLIFARRLTTIDVQKEEDANAADSLRSFQEPAGRLGARAMKKFNQLDADGNGVLEGEELAGLAEWVWMSFHEGSQPLRKQLGSHMAEEAPKLLGRDEDPSGAMSFEEFFGWFEKTCKGIEEYRKSLAHRKAYKLVLAKSNKEKSDVDCEVVALDAEIVISEAQKKFAELDADASGLLEGDEIVALAEWVWSSYHPAGAPLCDEQKIEEGSKLLSQLDSNSDGALSFEEFEDWFQSTCDSLAKRPVVAQSTSDTELEMGDAASEDVIDRMTLRAQQKFEQLDADANGVLEGHELISLGEWVWTSFHPNGQQMTEEQKVGEGSKLLGRLDENGDQGLSFDEFVGWFRSTCESIGVYRKKVHKAYKRAGVSRKEHVEKKVLKKFQPGGQKMNLAQRVKAAQGKIQDELDSLDETAVVQDCSSKRNPPSTISTEELHRYFSGLFQIADVNGDGVLQPNELTKLLQLCGLDLTPEEVVTFISHADVNHDGLIQYEEFVPLATKMLQSNHTGEVLRPGFRTAVRASEKDNLCDLVVGASVKIAGGFHKDKHGTIEVIDEHGAIRVHLEADDVHSGSGQQVVLLCVRQDLIDMAPAWLKHLTGHSTQDGPRGTSSSTSPQCNTIQERVEKIHYTQLGATQHVRMDASEPTKQLSYRSGAKLTNSDDWAKWIMHTADRHNRNGLLTVNELRTFLPRHEFTEWLTQESEKLLK